MAQTTVTATEATLPTISSFTASPTTINPGGSSTLEWKTSGATSLSINQRVGTVTGRTSKSVSPTSTTTYTLTATNLAGSVTATAKVTVRKLPTISSFTASPASIVSGGSSTLSWTTTNATSLSINQRVGTVTGRTSKSVSPTSTTTYTLTATNLAGSVTATAKVTVRKPTDPDGTISASPNPCTIAVGESNCTSTISWTARNTTQVKVFVSRNKATATNFATSSAGGRQSASWIKAAPANTYTFYLYDYSSGSRGAELASVTVTGTASTTPTLPTISSFTANPAAIDRGRSSTLSWTTSGATSLSISPGGTVTNSTSKTVSPSFTTTYTLTATNSAGSVRATAMVTVGRPPAPTINSFTASPTTIDSGGSSTLRWSITNATSLSISPGGTVTGASKSVSPSSTTTYTLTATNAEGSVTATATVTVRGPPTISSFTASPTTIDPGGSSTLSWTTANATSLSISPGGTVTGTSKTVSPSSTTTYTLTATNSAGSATATATVTVTGGPLTGTISASPNPCTIAVGSSTCTSTISWTVQNTNQFKVFVSRNRGSATTFATATGERGSKAASIQAAPANTHTFYLHGYSSKKRWDLLDSVEVTGWKLPTISGFTANPAAIDPGGSSTLSWTTTNATSLSISPGIGTVTGTSKSVSPSSTTTYTLTATNPVGSVTATAKVTVTPPPGPSGTISASPNPCTIAAGESNCTSTIIWTARNITQVKVFVSRNKATATNLATSSAGGRQSVSWIKAAPANTYTFYLYDYSSGSRGAELASVTVTGTASPPPPLPTISSFTASPTTINSGGSSILRWRTTNATSLSINQGVGTVTGTSKSVSPSSTTTYTLKATNSAGSVTATAKVTVRPSPPPPPTISGFTANPASIDPGGSSTLSWTTTNATSLSISPGIGTVTGTSKSVSPSSTTTYTLIATNSEGSATDTATVTVRPSSTSPPTINSFTADPETIERGEFSTLRWSTDGATSLSIDQGIGSVLRRRYNSRSPLRVSPSSTTTYTLTASNTAGSVTATVTVTVTEPTAFGILSASLNPCAIAVGKSSCTSTISWTVKNTTQVKVYFSINGGREIVWKVATESGSRDASWIRDSSNTQVFTLYDYSSGSRGKLLDSLTVTGRRVPTISSFSAHPGRITEGQSATLRWSTTNADTLFIIGIGTVTGTSVTVSPTSTTTYTLKATNAVRTVEATTTVTVTRTSPPTISSFTASPSTIKEGKSATLRWRTDGADTLSINPGPGTLTDRQRQLYERTGFHVSPTSRTTYTLTATNPVKSVTATVTVTVTRLPPPTISSFTADPATIAPGGSSLLIWSTANATSLSIDQGIGTVVNSTAFKSVYPTSTTTYTLTATNLAGEITATATVTVEGLTDKISFSPDPCKIYHGQTCIPTISWQSSRDVDLQVWYSLNGGEEQYFASSVSGGPHSKKGIELQATDTIVYKLYAYSKETQARLAELAKTDVTIQAHIQCPPKSSGN